jgi:Holliday junction DNA helicase RuvB
MSEIRPETLADIIGQTKAKRLLRIAINSAKVRNGVLGHTLLDAPAGTGKTTLARAIGNELGVKVTLLNGAGISKFQKLIPILDMQDRGDVLFIDEIHSMPTKVYENLYTAMEDWRYDVPGYGSQDIKQFSLIAASTHMGKLPIPLRSRFVNFIQLEPYSLAEMTEIVQRVAVIHGMSIKQNIAEILAKTCRHNPRVAVNRTAALRDYIITELKSSTVKSKDTHKIIDDVLSLHGVDRLGLTPNDHRYMELLRRTHALSIDSLCNKLNISKINVTTEIEPYLLELGLVVIERPHGRILNRERYKELFGNKR